MKLALLCIFFMVFAFMSQTNALCTPGRDTGVGWLKGCPFAPMNCNNHCLSLNNGYTSGGCTYMDCTCKCDR
uniref:Defensin n=2 Tax=Panagrolaimus TaxID=55784 RepID=A0A914P5U6_9BILA